MKAKQIGLFSLALLISQVTTADLNLGLLNDFEDGGLGGWTPPKANTANIATGGPTGAGDNFLQVSPAPRLSAFRSTGVAGIIDPAVTSIRVDMMRPVGQASLDIRMVLFGPGTGNRWTSTVSQVLPGDGNWATYTFSIMEVDLTQVLGADPYANLTSNLNRIMFRYDTGTPSANGDIGTGTFGIDNVDVIPEPSSVALMGVAGGCIWFFRKKLRVS